MDVQQHDALLAASSHMPHVVAYALTRALERDASDPMIHGGGALRDMTRIAGSDPRMWTDIAVTNRQALLAAIDQFEAEMTMLRELVDLKDAQALEEYFSICRAHRRDHDGILNPISETAAKENHEV
jgi:prephenate dehydrogenase